MINSLEETARKLRRRIIEYSYKTKTPHLGSCLSCIDILVVLYFDIANVNPNSPNDPDRDKVILSKGHAAPALFQVLALKGFFPYESLINSDHVNGGLFGEHPPTPSHLPGIEAATGSLGHGMPMGVGMAMANRIQGRDARVFAVLGDGECNEGSIWEAAMFAGSHRLDNLTVIVDFNKWQATDRSSDVLAINPFKDKWSAFGWNTFEVDGHDIPSMIKLLQSDSNKSGQPLAIIAHTVKGKGIDFMEDDNNWHYRTPNAVEFAMALEQLGYDQ